MNMEVNDTAAHTESCVPNMMRAFRFGNVDIRTFAFENGGPWFGVQDICDVLGEERLEAALDRIDEGGKRIAVVHVNPGFDAVAVVNEDGLTKMVAGHPQAGPLLEWAARDVVPLFHARRIAAATAQQFVGA